MNSAGTELSQADFAMSKIAVNETYGGNLLRKAIDYFCHLAVAPEFLAHAKEEQEHADRIAERIVQLGGEPDFSPDGMAKRSHAEYVEGGSLVDMIKEDLVAERIAIESYLEMIAYLEGRDPTTRRLLEEILANEEEHADDLNSLLEGMQVK